MSGKDPMQILKKTDSTPSGWLSLEAVSFRIAESCRLSIHKQVLGRIASKLGVRCMKYTRITEYLMHGRLRKRSTVVTCMREQDVAAIECYVLARLSDNEPLLDPVDDPKRPDPTPEEIRKRCAEIQAGWSDRERESRRVGPRDKEVETIIYKVEYLRNMHIRLS